MLCLTSHPEQSTLGHNWTYGPTVGYSACFASLSLILNPSVQCVVGLRL